MEVIAPYTGDMISLDELERIVREIVNFEIPLVKITDAISSLELKDILIKM